jgi:hypothetical protein
MPFGNQTISFVNRTTTGAPDELGNYPLAETTTDAPGCRHRPLTFSETAEFQMDIATQPYKTTIPIGEYSADLRELVLAIKPNDVIRVTGVEFQIIGGIRHHPNMDSSPFKATLISRRQVG